MNLLVGLLFSIALGLQIQQHVPGVLGYIIISFVSISIGILLGFVDRKREK